MSQRPFDLSSLPPEMRRAVGQQLAKLPPQAREKLLREGSPLLEKMLTKLVGTDPPPLPANAARQARQAAGHAAQHVATAREHAAEARRLVTRIAPKGHYNATVRPGDSIGGGRLLMWVLAAAVLIATFWR